MYVDFITKRLQAVSQQFLEPALKRLEQDRHRTRHSGRKLESWLKAGAFNGVKQERFWQALKGPCQFQRLGQAKGMAGDGHDETRRERGT